MSVVDRLPDASVYSLDASDIPFGADMSDAGGVMLVARAARTPLVVSRPAWRHILAWAVAACLAPSCTGAGGDAVAQTNPQSRSVGRTKNLPPSSAKLSAVLIHMTSRTEH